MRIYKKGESPFKVVRSREMDIDNFQVTMTFTLMTTLEAMQDWNASGLDDNDLIEIAKYDIERVIKSCVDYTKL